MLEAKKSAVCEKLFAIYNRNFLRRRFHAFHVCGLQNLQNLTLPCIVYANHSSWWDGLAAFKIWNLLKLDSFIMMEEKQLANLQFFRRLGAFSVVRENRRQAADSVNYAVKIIQSQKPRTLWIFPQGEILPHDKRPLLFFNGLSHIVKKVKDCVTVPVGFRYEFLGNYKPEIFVKVGHATRFSAEQSFGKKDLTNNFVSEIGNLLSEINHDINSNNLDKYQNII